MNERPEMSEHCGIDMRVPGGGECSRLDAADSGHGRSVSVLKIDGEFCDRRGIEDADDVNVLAEHLLQFIDEDRGLDRISSEREEVIVHADMIDPQRLLPHSD